MVLAVSYQFTGINSVLAYTNSMFSNLKFNSQFEMTAANAAYLIGIANFLSSIISVLSAGVFGRKFLLIVGHFAIALCMILLGFFASNNFTIDIISLLLFYLFIFQTTLGPIFWIYITEVLVDSAIGFTVSVFFGAMTFISLVSLPIIESNYKLQGLFWVFGFVTLIGGLISIAYVKETQELSDREKRELYKQKAQLSGSFPKDIEKIID